MKSSCLLIVGSSTTVSRPYPSILHEDATSLCVGDKEKG